MSGSTDETKKVGGGGILGDNDDDVYSLDLNSSGGDSKSASEYDSDSNGKGGGGRRGRGGGGRGGVSDGGGMNANDFGVARRETKAVGGLRWCVVFVLVVSMTLVAVTTYFYLREEEMSEFEEQFQGDSFKILSSLGASLDKAIAGVDAYVISMLSYAHETNQTWPFVTVPDFEARSEKFLALTRYERRIKISVSLSQGHCYLPI